MKFSRACDAVFILRYFHPCIGGMEKQALTLAAALHEKGVRITIITGRIRHSWPAREVIQNVPVVRLPAPDVKYIGAAVFICNLIVHLFRTRTSFSIIHTFQVCPTSAAAILLAKMLGKPAVLKLACSGPGGDVQKNSRSIMGKLLLAFSMRADAAIVLNAEMQQELAGAGFPAARIFRIPNGVDTSVYHPAACRLQAKRSLGIPACPVLLYAGRILFAQKRLDLLAQALSKMKSVGVFLLYIIGEGPDESRLQRLCAKLDLGDTVRILKKVHDIAPYYQAADIFILPSRYEGLSNSILEAMASGCAVLATDITGNRELIKNGSTGVLVPCDSQEHLARAMRELIENTDQAASMGARAQLEICGKFAVGEVAASYADLYQSLRVSSEHTTAGEQVAG